MAPHHRPQAELLTDLCEFEVWAEQNLHMLLERGGEGLKAKVRKNSGGLELRIYNWYYRNEVRATAISVCAEKMAAIDHMLSRPPARNSMSASAASSDAAAPKTSSPQPGSAAFAASFPVFSKVLDDIGADSDSDMPDLDSESYDAAKAERACGEQSM